MPPMPWDETRTIYHILTWNSLTFCLCVPAPPALLLCLPFPQVGRWATCNNRRQQRVKRTRLPLRVFRCRACRCSDTAFDATPAAPVPFVRHAMPYRPAWHSHLHSGASLLGARGLLRRATGLRQVSLLTLLPYILHNLREPHADVLHFVHFAFGVLYSISFCGHASRGSSPGPSAMDILTLFSLFSHLSFSAAHALFTAYFSLLSLSISLCLYSSTLPTPTLYIYILYIKHYVLCIC